MVGGLLLLRSVPGTVIEGRALGGQILTEPAQVLTQQPDLIHPLIMLALGADVSAILSRLDRRHALTDLARQLVQIITQIGAVVICNLLLSGLGSLMHRIYPTLETGRERLELDRYHPADRDA